MPSEGHKRNREIGAGRLPKVSVFMPRKSADGKPYRVAENVPAERLAALEGHVPHAMGFLASQ